MATRELKASESLRKLKPSAELETVPVSRLARKGTELLSELVESSQAVAVQVQGVGSMVTLSRRQYDELVALVQGLGEENIEGEDDGFARALRERFDALVSTMNRSGGQRAVDEALFGDVDRLNASYQPGDTESDADSAAELAD